MFIHNGINVFAEYMDGETLSQFSAFIKGRDDIVKAALMPDAHLGYSVPIGSVFASNQYVYPAAVGYDIGCGMCAVKTTFRKNEVARYAKEIVEEIYRTIPVGFKHNEREVVEAGAFGALLDSTNIMRDIYTNGRKQLGTLGGGNHFIEIGYEAEDNSVWIIIHSGSRGIGHAVATHYMKLASGEGKAKEGSYGFDVNSTDGNNYIKDMNACLSFALVNRKVMLDRVVAALRGFVQGDKEDITFINRNHNHAEEKNGLWIHRKGATHAEAGMMGVIPGNMRDGSFIVVGRGNEDSLCSSSHGAGRVLGRKKAKEILDVDKFRAEMTGIVANVNENTLDESPFAYKNIFDVMKQQNDLVSTIGYVKPILNVKG